MFEKNKNEQGNLVNLFLSESEVDWVPALRILLDKYRLDFVPIFLNLIIDNKIPPKKVNNIAILLSNNKFHWLAIKAFQIILEKEKYENPAHLNNYGVVLNRAGKKDEAIIAFRKAWKIDLLIEGCWYQRHLRAMRLQAFKNMITLKLSKYLPFFQYGFIFGFIYILFFSMINLIFPLLQLFHLINTFLWISIIIPNITITPDILIEILKILIQVNGFALGLTGVLISFILRVVKKEYQLLLIPTITCSLLWFIGAILWSIRELVMIGSSQSVNAILVLLIPLNCMLLGIINTLITISFSTGAPRELQLR